MRLSTLLAGIVAAVAIASPFVAARPRPAEGECKMNDSPAYAQTKASFEGFKNARMYILGSIINDDPTHLELQEAAKWQLGEVQKSYDAAKAANDGDTKWLRKQFYATKLMFLKVEMGIANKMVNKGLPKLPWLGKVYNWVQGKWKKIKEWWEKLFGKKDPKPAAGAPEKKKAVEVDGIEVDATEVSEGEWQARAHDSKMEAIDRHIEELDNGQC